MRGASSDDYPPGWAVTTLGTPLTWGSGGTPLRSRAEYYDGDIPWAIIGDLSDGPISKTSSFITELGLRESAAKCVPPGSVLLAMYGSIGKLGINSIPLTTNQAIAFTHPSPIDAEYLFYYLMSARSELISRGKGGTQSNISQAVIKAFPFVVAPQREQHRIVEAIESYFTRLDDAVATLERVQRNLKRYRASVLKAAVEGRLVPTEAELARAEGRDYEPASVLLERILAERRGRWEEAELAKMKAKGKPLKDDRWKAKYKEPVAPDTTGLPELPEGWCWAGPDQVAAHEEYALGIGPFGSNLKVSDYRDDGVPLVFVRNIRSERFDNGDQHHLTHAKASELAPHIVRSGDILVTKMGEPPGDAAIYPPGSPDGVITADCIRLRNHPSVSRTRYLLFAIRSPLFRDQIVRITKGVAQKKVSLARFKNIALPLAPRAEQDRIAPEIDRLLSVADVLEKTTEQESRRLARLRQSILKWAFEGRLVNQDPTDEPASRLLERIQADRKSPNSKARRRRRRARARPSKA